MVRQDWEAGAGGETRTLDLGIERITGGIDAWLLACREAA